MSFEIQILIFIILLLVAAVTLYFGPHVIRKIPRIENLSSKLPIIISTMILIVALANLGTNIYFHFQDEAASQPISTNPSTPLQTPASTVIPTQTPVQTPETIVSISGVNYQYSWKHSPLLPYSEGYWYTSDQGSLTTDAGKIFTYDIKFTSHALKLSHTIESITIGTSGFTLERIDPPLPSEPLTTGSSITERLTIQAPNSKYDGPLEIDVISH